MPEINLDDIPEQFRNLFVDRDGQLAFDAESLSGNMKSAEDVRRALSARDNERAEAANLRKQLEELQSKFQGIDADRLPDAMTALERLDEMEQQRLISEKRYEEAAEKKYQRQIAEMKRQLEQLGNNMNEEKQRYEALFGDYGKVRIQDMLSREFLEAGIDPDFLDVAIATESRRWEIDPETREPVPVEFIDGGKTKVTATGANGQPLTMKEHARTFVRERPKFAMPSNGTGSSHQNSANRSANGDFTMTRTQAKDLRAYEQMREQAIKAGTMVQVVPDPS